MPKFREVYDAIQKAGSASAVSRKGVEYTILAYPLKSGPRRGEPAIVAKPTPDSRVYIHEDCWGDDITCLESRAGGIYNGSPSIYDWYSNFIRNQR